MSVSAKNDAFPTNPFTNPRSGPQRKLLIFNIPNINRINDWKMINNPQFYLRCRVITAPFAINRPCLRAFSSIQHAPKQEGKIDNLQFMCLH